MQSKSTNKRTLEEVTLDDTLQEDVEQYYTKKATEYNATRKKRRSELGREFVILRGCLPGTFKNTKTETVRRSVSYIRELENTIRYLQNENVNLNIRNNELAFAQLSYSVPLISDQTTDITEQTANSDDPAYYPWNF